jgi:hypothetical protein
MGGFQAVASGLGGAGEDMGVGLNNALNEALKVRAQLHGEDVDASRLALEKAGQQQQYNLAQQVHELTRQQIIQSGWKDMGATVNPNGTYSRTFYNEQLPEGQNKKVVPLSGVPPDSAAGLFQHYQMIRDQKDENGKPLFTDLQAKQVAYKMPNLYREGPAGIVDSFMDSAKDQAANGVKKIRIPGLGSFDITTPGGIANYAQAVLSTIHPGGLYRALSPAGQGAKDMTGWTAGEKREFDALAGPLRASETAMGRMADVQMANTLDPAQQDIVRKQYLESVTNAEKQIEEKAAEISNRHHGAIAFQVPAGAPSAAGQADGTPLYNSKHQVVARAKGNQWGPP